MPHFSSSSDPIPELALPSDSLLTIRRIRGSLDDVELGPRRYEQHAVLLAEADSGVHSIDLVEHRLEPGRAFFIRPGQVHCFHGAEVDVVEIHYSLALLARAAAESFLAMSHGVTYVARPPLVRRRLATLIEQMFEEHGASEPDWNMLRPLLAALLHTLARLRSEQPRAVAASQYEARVERLRALLSTECSIQARADDYARRLQLSSKRLNEITRAHVGKTISQMARESVVTEAQRALALSDESIKSISYRLGFEDPSYFSRFFRREVGETPSAFREKMRPLRETG